MGPIILYSLKHPVSVITIFIGILMLGLFSISGLRIEQMPELDYPELMITTKAENLPAEEVEEMITRRVRDTLSTIKGLETIASESSAGLSSIRLSLQWGADLERAAAEAAEKLEALYQSLAEPAEKPLVKKSAGSTGFILLAATAQNAKEAAELLPILKSELLSKSYISAVSFSGLPEEKLYIQADMGKLSSAGSSLRAVASAIKTVLLTRPAGEIIDNGLVQSLTIGKDEVSLNDIQNITVKGEHGPVPLKELSRIEPGFDIDNTVFYYSGADIDVTKEDLYNTGILLEKSSSTGIIAASKRFKSEFEDLKTSYSNIDIKIIHDFSVPVKRELGSIAAALLMGTTAAFLLVFLVFRKLKLCLCCFLPLPVCFAAVLIFLRLSGNSLNVVSLTAASIGIGMIADNNIVVIDRLMSSKKENFSGTLIETSRVTSASAVTGIIVFIPLFIQTGLLSGIFSELAAVICIFTAVSYIASLTLTPAIFSTTNSEHIPTPPGPPSKLSKPLVKLFGRRKLWIVLWSALLLSVFFLIFQTPKELIPDCEETVLEGRIVTGSPLTEAARVLGSIFKNIEGIQSVIISSSPVSGWKGHGRINADLPDNHTFYYLSRLNSRKDVEKAELSLNTAAKKMGFHNETAPPQNPLFRFISQTQAKAPFIKDEQILTVVINKMRAADSSITASEIVGDLKNQLQGISAGSFSGTGSGAMEVIVRAEDRQLANLKTIDLPFDQLLSIKKKTVPALIINNNTVVPGVFSKELARSFTLVIFLIILVAGIQFNSFSAPFFLIPSVFLSAAGGLAASALLSGSLNIQTASGLLISSGTSINIWILLYDSVKKPSEIYSQMLVRLKPAGLTTGVTLAALIPAVIIPGPQTSSAAAVLGGIAAASVSGFTLLPALLTSASKLNKGRGK